MLLARVVLVVAALSHPIFAQGVITRIAGADWLFPANGLPALNAPLSGAQGLDIALDNKGNYYIADGGNLMVMRVGPDGIVDVIAGNGVFLASGDGGLAVNAAIFQPTAVVVDSFGTVYIADYGSSIRKVTADGLISTFAGTGNSGWSGDNGLATEAELHSPLGLAIDPAGNVYIADTYNNRIRKVSTTGIITTVAGNGKPGSSGDGGSALAAEIYFPTRLAVDGAGNIYFTETINPVITPNPRVRKVDAQGKISTVAGGHLDPSDGIPAIQAGLLPIAVAVDAVGNLYIVDLFRMGIRKVDTNGIITTVAGGSGVSGFGGDGGPALKALFAFQAYPSIAVDSGGNIYVDDEANERVRKITRDGIVRTIAGNGLYRFSGNGGPAASATLDYPVGMTGDTSGNLYVSEQLQSRIRRIAKDGTISTYVGNGHQGFSGDGGPASSASIAFPSFLAINPIDGYLYFADTINCRIRYIDHGNIMHTFAGGGACDDSGDNGPAANAGLRAPTGIDFDNLGNLYISEPQSNRIRAVIAPPDSRILTLAGAADGHAGYSGDGGSSTSAVLNYPVGVRYHDGSLYFCDSGNNVVRKIDGNFTITTVAGTGKAGYSGDGGPALNAWLNNPQSINFDTAGNMYIADQLNRLIRIVTPDGNIHTFAGSQKAKTENDGGLATNAGLGAPSDIFVDAAGNVLFTDLFYNRVRAVLANAPTFQATPSSLAFTAPAGSTPQDQSIDVVGSIPGIPFTVSITSSAWLQVSTTSGVMPASIRVTVDPSKLSAGSYKGSIQITASGAKPSTRTIQVALTAAAQGSPSLNVKPGSLTFSFVKGAAAGTRPVVVSNVGGGSLSFTAAAATVGGGSWLSVIPSSGSLNAYSSSTVTITANPNKITPGTYSGTVTFSSKNPAESVIVPVTMSVTAVPQTILIPQTGLTFFAVQGGATPPPQLFNILNSGTGLMTYTTTPATISGASWLSAFPANGSCDASSPVVPQIRIDTNPKGLKGGVYYGTVQVTSPSANNSPQFVAIILNVLAPGSKIGPIVEPSGLIFTGVAGGESPGSQTVTVQSTDSAPSTFHSGQITANGGSWLTSLPTDATVTGSQPARIVIQPKTTGLAAGVYRGTLTLSFTDGFTRTVAIVLVLVPSGSPASTSATSIRAVSSCKAKTLVPVFTQLSSGFSIPAGFPGQVAVKVVDDCANPMTNGDVSATFSNGDPEMRLISLKDGTWAGTWIPSNPTSPITVTAVAQSAEGLAGNVKITGSLQASGNPPAVGQGAVVNGASFASATPVAPGSLVTIFGSKLADGQAFASELPLPTNLGGSSIALAGRQAPLLFASDGQVNAVIPYGTAVNAQQQLLVLHGSRVSIPQSVTLSAVAPGIFTADGSGKGQGTVFIGNGTTLANASHPAHSGNVVVIFCTGLGEVTPAVPTGSPAPSAPPAKVVNDVKVSIGGVDAPVQFAGLTPGLVGVYQVNAVVPSVAAGNQVPVVISAAGQRSLAVTIAVR